MAPVATTRHDASAIVAILFVVLGPVFVASAIPTLLGREGWLIPRIPLPVALAIAVATFSISLRLLI